MRLKSASSPRFYCLNHYENNSKKIENKSKKGLTISSNSYTISPSEQKNVLFRKHVIERLLNEVIFYNSRFAQHSAPCTSSVREDRYRKLFSKRLNNLAPSKTSHVVMVTFADSVFDK